MWSYICTYATCGFGLIMLCLGQKFLYFTHLHTHTNVHTSIYVYTFIQDVIFTLTFLFFAFGFWLCRTLHLCCWQSNLRRRLIICKAFLQVYGPTSPCCIARTIPLTHISYIYMYMYMYMDICSDTNKWIHNYIYMQTNNLYNIYIYIHIHLCISFSAYVYKVDYCPYVMPLAWHVQYQFWDIHLRIYL